jgi:uncharacterized protein YkwD
VQSDTIVSTMERMSCGSRRSCSAYLAIGPVVLVVLCLGACVAAPPGSGPAPAPGTLSTRQRGSSPDTVADAYGLEPGHVGVRAYGEELKGALDWTPLDLAVAAMIRERARDLKVPEPRWDDRLGLVAGDLARVAPPEGTLDYEVVEFALSHYGIVEPTPHLFVVWTTRAPIATVVTYVRDRIGSMLAEGGYGRFGVGTAERGSDRMVLAVAFQVSAVELEPLPRELALGARARVRGRVLAPYERPDVVVALEDGSVGPVAVERQGKRGFSAEVRCGSHSGKLQVEVSAIGPEGAAVLANFPIWCGTSPPRRLAFAAAGARAVSVSSDEAEGRLLALVNGDRRAAGLPALAVDPEVAKVARAYSAEMAKTGVVAHVSALSGDVSDRLMRGGVRRPLVEENLARSSSVESAHQGLMNSPGHRANILSPAVTHIGVGVVGAPAEVGSTDLLVTEVFVRLPPPVDRQMARAQVAAIMKKRFAMVEDHELDVLAQRKADAAAKKGTGDASDIQVASDMAEAAGRFKRLRAMMVALADVEQLESEELPSNFKGMRLGVGIGQGAHPTLGPSALYVVLLVAEPK